VSFRQQTQFARPDRKGRRRGPRPWRCHPSGGGCAKQTQFPGHRISQHSTTLSFHRPNPTPIVQNEANFREPTGRAGGRVCKTKPNLGRMGYLEEGEPGKSQWCRTNPIPGGVGWNGVQRCRTRSNCATSPRCPASGNKANSSITDSGGPAVRRLGLPGPVVQTNPIQPGAGGVRSRGRREMRNEPNSRRGRVGRGRRGVGRLCKTNPISTTGARSLRPGSKPPGVPALVRVYPGRSSPTGRQGRCGSPCGCARKGGTPGPKSGNQGVLFGSGTWRSGFWPKNAGGCVFAPRRWGPVPAAWEHEAGSRRFAVILRGQMLRHIWSVR
jgi:hypothetical protein